MITVEYFPSLADGLTDFSLSCLEKQTTKDRAVLLSANSHTLVGNRPWSTTGLHVDPCTLHCNKKLIHCIHPSWSIVRYVDRDKHVSLISFIYVNTRRGKQRGLVAIPATYSYKHMGANYACYCTIDFTHCTTELFIKLYIFTIGNNHPPHYLCLGCNQISAMLDEELPWRTPFVTNQSKLCHINRLLFVNFAHYYHKTALNFCSLWRIAVCCIRTQSIVIAGDEEASFSAFRHGASVPPLHPDAKQIKLQLLTKFIFRLQTLADC